MVDNRYWEGDERREEGRMGERVDGVVKEREKGILWAHRVIPWYVTWPLTESGLTTL